MLIYGLKRAFVFLTLALPKSYIFRNNPGHVHRNHFPRNSLQNKATQDLQCLRFNLVISEHTSAGTGRPVCKQTLRLCCTF